MDANNVGKLIRGVVYDDIDSDGMRSDMIGILDDLYGYDEDTIRESPGIQLLMEDTGLTFEEAMQYFHNMDAIAALTRHNFVTGENHNLIIPKEALSRGLVADLQKVDLGENLFDHYQDNFVKNHYFKDSVEPEDFCDSDEETLLQHVDRVPVVKIIVNDDAKVQDFAEVFTKVIKGIEASVKGA